MKGKKFVTLAVCMVFVVQMLAWVPIVSFAEGNTASEGEQYRLYDDFSNGGADGKITHTAPSVAPYTISKLTAEIKADPLDESNQAAYLSSTLINTENPYMQVRPASSEKMSFKDKTILAFRFMMPTAATEHEFKFELCDFNWFRPIMIKDGKIYANNSYTDINRNLIAEHWYDARIFIDGGASKQVDTYIDYKRVNQCNYSTAPASGDFMSRFRIYAATSNADKPASVYIDDIKIYTISPTKIVSDTETTNTNTFDLKFNNDIDEGYFGEGGAVSIYKGSALIEKAKRTITKKPGSLRDFTITFSDALEDNQEYTIKITGGIRDITRTPITAEHKFKKLPAAQSGPGIKSIDGYEVDQAKNTITTIQGRLETVQEFLNKIITNDDTDTISVTKDGKAVDGTEYLKAGMKVEVKNAQATQSKEYTVVYSYYVNTTFDEYTSKASGSDGLFPDGFTGGDWGTYAPDNKYVEGVADGLGGNMLKFYNRGLETANRIQLNVSGFPTITSKKIMVSEADIKLEDKNTFEVMYVGGRATDTYYLKAIEFTADGKLRAFNNDVTTYEANHWYHILSIYDFETDIGKLYINGTLAGERLKSGFFPAGNAFTNLKDVRVLSGGNASSKDSTTYFDDFKLYEIGSIDGYELNLGTLRTDTYKATFKTPVITEDQVSIPVEFSAGQDTASLPLVLFVAQYGGEQLNDVQFTETSLDAGTKEIQCAYQKLADNELRIMLWDSIANMVPLTALYAQ